MSTQTTSTRVKTTESHVKLATPELPAGIRSGGEKRPFGYPHLYQIQAGDWRISYAVEHDRLAILVLEVLRAEGGAPKDPATETMTKQMKVKLLDWPEGSGTAQTPPEEISKKLKIKWLDMGAESDDSQPEATHGTSRIKLKGTSDNKTVAHTPTAKHTITLLDAGEPGPADETAADQPAHEDLMDQERRITPVDEPSV